MFAMIGKAIDGSQPHTLMLGLAVFCVPAIMFTVYGIIDKRGVMFAVHAFFLAFWIFVVINNAGDFGESFTAVMTDASYLLVFLLTVVISFFVWFFVIKFFFARRS